MSLDANLQSRNRRIMLLVLVVAVLGIIGLAVYLMSDGEAVDEPAGVAMGSVPTPEGKLRVGSRLSEYRWGVGGKEGDLDSSLSAGAAPGGTRWHVEYEGEESASEADQLIDSMFSGIAAANAAVARESQMRKQREEVEKSEQMTDPLALLEKSYELSAKYNRQNQQSGAGSPAVAAPVTPAPASRGARSTGVPSTALPRERVEVKVEEQVGDGSARLVDTSWRLPPRVNAFYGLSDAQPEVLPNSIRAVVDQAVTLKQNEYVKLRLLDPLPTRRVTMPAGSIIIAQGRVEGNRMRLFVERLERDGYIFRVRLSAFDLDGQEGIFIPLSDELNAAQEVGVQVSNTAGTNLTMNSTAKDQVIGELSRIAITSAAKYVEAKIRELRIHLKSGYRLFLVVQDDQDKSDGK